MALISPPGTRTWAVGADAAEGIHRAQYRIDDVLDVEE